MAERCVVAPAEEPVSLAEAKLHLRLTTDDEDLLLQALLQAARERVEMHTNRALVTSTWEEMRESWPWTDRFELPRPPLQAVEWIRYRDVANVEHELGPEHYDAPAALDSGRVVLAYLHCWPTVMLRPAAPITIRYEAGYGAAAEVPGPIRAAILLLVAHLYEHREAVVVGNSLAAAEGAELPLGVKWLLAPYRVRVFGETC